MSDIVERLREAAASLSEIYPDYAEAADEITRLRAENEKLLEALNNVVSAVYSTRASIGVACIDIQVIDRARAALEGVTEKEGAGNE